MPPPPPPAPPPPPSNPAFNLDKIKNNKSDSSDGRNLLLDSIRQGKQLKKTTIVNDRSSPLVSNTQKNGASDRNNRNINTTTPVGGGGLGNIFSGGIPKLKSVAKKDYRPEPPPQSLKPTHTQNNEVESVSINNIKPSVAPKPPTLGSKPARPFCPQSNNQGVSRTHSMKVSSPPSQHQITTPISFGTIGRTNQIVSHMQNSTNNNSGIQKGKMNIIRPPSEKPPPPPPNKNPPADPPPRPPHRVTNQNTTLGPLPPVPQTQPPPPPTRNSSIRNSGVDLEGRFRHLFYELNELPNPEPYTGILKTYPSKIAQSVKRQPAPQPPTQIQLGGKLWENNTSVC